jgi:hypothetical protein
MKRKRVMKSLVWCVALLFAGCATYTPQPTLRLEPSGDNVSKMVQGDIILYVEEYATKEKSKQAFDTDLAKKGVLPLRITVENNGEQPYEVQSSDILVRDGTTALSMLTPQEASRKAKRNAIGRAVGWSLIVPIIAIPIAAASSAIHTSKVNKRIVQDFVAKGFLEGAVQPHQKQTGFLYFALPDGRKDLAGLQLELAAKNLATDEHVVLTTALPVATFAPNKVAQSQQESGDGQKP